VAVARVGVAVARVGVAVARVDILLAVVDVADADKAHRAVQELNVTPKLLLTTHHHADHCAGNEAFVKLYPNVEVLGGDDRIPALKTKVKNGDEVRLSSTITFSVLAVPCHTRGHVLFLAKASDHPQFDNLFTGDTLFVGGCGRFFEGNAKEMLHNLSTTIGTLSHQTRVWCGHEYTVANLIFAEHIEPSNVDIRQKLKESQDLVSSLKHTVPSILADEFKYNPFMRVNVAAVKRAVGSESDDDETTMAKLREAKNNFKAPAKI